MHSFVCAFFLGVPPLPSLGRAAGSGYTLLCASWGRRIPLLSLTREGVENPLATVLDKVSLSGSSSLKTPVGGCLSVYKRLQTTTNVYKRH